MLTDDEINPNDVNDPDCLHESGRLLPCFLIGRYKGCSCRQENISLEPNTAELLAWEMGLLQCQGLSFIEQSIDDVLKTFPEKVLKAKTGDEASLNFIVGRSMQKLKGKGQFENVQKMVRVKIDKTE